MISPKSLRFVFCLVVIALLALVYIDTLDQKNQKLLNKFSEAKEGYGVLLDGIVVYNGDTVFFHLIPPVSFSIESSETDRIVVKHESDKLEFYRSMINDHSVPAPGEDGKKFMTSWKSPDSGSSFELLYSVILKKVLKYGQVQYGDIRTKPEMAKYLAENYGLTLAKAKKEAEKAMKNF